MVQKRKACDECRSRKLACSKEDGGCERCGREGVVCVYSEQKPMGRPRKRRFLEKDGDDEGVQQCSKEEDGCSMEQQVNNDHMQHPEFPVLQEPNMADFDFGLLDSDFGAWNNLGDGFLLNNDFFNDPNLLDPYISHEVLQSEPGLSGDTETEVRNGNPISTPENGTIWHFGKDTLPPNIDFGASSNDFNENSPKTKINPSSSSTTDLQTTFDFEQESSPPLENKPVLCNCLTSLYVALSSLQILPVDTTLAMSTIRQAAYTAQTVMRCKHCGNCTLTEDFTPPTISRQNHMLLGTLLPVIADSYKRLLAMIDDRYASAISCGSKILFQPGSYGGFKTITSQTCPITREGLVEMEIEPAAWRMAVRGLLRADVYGIDESYGGLKGLIREMEVAQRSRHDCLDALKGEGLLVVGDEGLCGAEEKDRTCERILDVAREALERLVIA